MGKSEPILRLIGTAARGAYDRAEESTTAKAATETDANASSWDKADADLTSKADGAISAASDVYSSFKNERATKHAEDLAAIVVMAGDVKQDVLDLIAADNNLDALLATREGEYLSAWTAEGATEEGVFAEFSAIFNA
tara:strand:- start:242 stop:655 length:414 start_codon:yes stop_codon:yes gene_type:complete